MTSTRFWSARAVSLLLRKVSAGSTCQHLAISPGHVQHLTKPLTAKRCPRRVCTRATPSWLSNPAFAHREALRVFYLASSTDEMVDIVVESAEVLDLSTSLHMLCFAADMSLKGRLVGEAEELVQALHATVADHIPHLNPVQLGSLLWGLASLVQASALTDGVIQRVAAQELCNKRVPSYNTKELCSILDASAKLVRGHSSPEITGYVTAVVAELVKRICDLPYVRSSLSASDCADLSTSISRIYQHPAPSSSSSSGLAFGPLDAAASGGGGVGTFAAASLPPPAAKLLDELAEEIRRQMANKHSLRSPFTPRELVVFISSYATLHYRSDKVSGMLDAVAGFVVRRIHSRHLNAVSRPEDLAGLLRAYAALRHNSVAIPELLAAVGEQVCRNAAQDQMSHTIYAEGAASSGSTDTEEGTLPDSSAATAPPRPPAVDLAFPICYVIDILHSFAGLGYAPPRLMLQALMPSICRQLPVAPAPQVLHLLELLTLLRCHPGHLPLTLILARLADSSEGDQPQQGASKEGGADMVGAGLQLVAQLEQGHGA